MKSTSQKFKVLIAALTTLMMLTLPGVAEEGRKGRHRGNHGEKMLQKMTENLNLSEDQAAQIKSIFDSHKATLDQLRGQIKQTLTDDQRKALRQARKNRKSNGGERPSRDEMRQKFAEMGISEGQQQQMRSIRKQIKQERKQIKSEIMAVLTPEQQSQFEALKAQRKARRQEKRSQRQQ